METKETALGSIYLLASRILTLACGMIIHIFLARRLGPEIYGLYGFIMSILLWAEYTIMAGIPSTYRKVISEDENMFDSVIYSIKRVFVPYCLMVLALFSLASPLVSQALDDSRLLVLLLIAGIDIPFYGIYYAQLSILNGRGEFIQLSLVVTGYALFKAVLVIIFVLLEFGIIGALIGNTLASFSALLVTFSFIKGLKSQQNKRKKFDLNPRIVTFGLPYLLYFLTSMLLIHIDMWFVKGLLNDDMMTGYYSASYNLTRPVFFLITGIMVVVFPAFSEAVSKGDTQLLQKYIRQTMRFAVVILFPLTIIIGSTSEEFITLLFSSKYLPASNSLKILLSGISIFSIFSLFLNFIAAKNKPFYSFIISFGLLPIAIVLNYFFIHLYGIVGAALAITVISSIGLIVSGAYLWRIFGVIINFTTLSRVILATGCLYLISKYTVTSGYYIILEYLILSLIYLFLLLALREINRGDLIIIRESFYPLLKRIQILKDFSL